MSLTLTPLQVTDCDREPIHAPGSIQPHGMMLVADRSDLRVRHVAGDVERHLGGADWLGKPLRARQEITESGLCFSGYGILRSRRGIVAS
jgi:light-regulated signal transduction histidine kinase (bacteriophytochrome)